MNKLAELLSELQLELDNKNPFADVQPVYRKASVTEILEGLNNFKLTSYERLILVVVYDKQLVHISEMKNLTHISQPTLQRILVNLQKLGLIRKVRNGVYTRELNIY